MPRARVGSKPRLVFSQPSVRTMTATESWSRHYGICGKCRLQDGRECEVGKRYQVRYVEEMDRTFGNSA